MRHIPTCLYIDTSVFKGSGLRFDTQTFNTLKQTFVPRGLRLLVPKMMERELLRHFHRRAEAVAVKIIDAHNHKNYPINKLNLAELPAQTDIEAKCFEEMEHQWSRFKDHFMVVNLPIVGNLEDIVDWYLEIRPPPPSQKLRIRSFQMRLLSAH